MKGGIEIVFCTSHSVNTSRVILVLQEIVR